MNRFQWVPLLRAGDCRIDLHLLDGKPLNAVVNGGWTSTETALAVALPIMEANPREWWMP